MSRIPVISGKDLIRILEKSGYSIRDQKGSHVHLRHPVKPPLTVPDHKIIAKGTLRAIIREAEMSMDEFLELA